MTFAEYYQNRLLQQQQQEAGTPGSSGAGTGGPGSSVGRAAPRMIRTSSAASSAPGVAEGPAASAGGGEGGKWQRRAEGRGAAALVARVDGSNAAAASSDAPEAMKQEPVGSRMMNERHRPQALTQMAAVAARSSGPAGARAGNAAAAAAAATATFSSVVTGTASTSAPREERDGTRMELQPPGAAAGERNSGEGDSLGPSTSPASSPEAGPASNGGDLICGTGMGPGAEAAAASPRVDDVVGAADPEAAKRAAERLRSLALAAQRLKSWPLKDEPKGGAADGGGGGLALQRPGRPAR
ncbi:hypothetical protein VOLCADRAFT_117169 [Volvox carteri f. nagariensis]|uniref:Uncharacterized protein n=1 Tax=Volvox carteri f. nagariensis TaxID=3068 RepID=D8TSI6_VOLCA|nr:uncharacterized protein VOLCADRAFT_117169 [Volvox carteri f. nagariensis]EFJ49493.1 hypothetical protein VOLCADRAFT_117169 [Volvox carteri f. nagariensis]|eukprot:XP_002949474.1 hypothetical protein VOLCADRAFT_117169 [Volvox carteri f. nagariensis]